MRAVNEAVEDLRAGIIPNHDAPKLGKIGSALLKHFEKFPDLLLTQPVCRLEGKEPMLFEDKP